MIHIMTGPVQIKNHEVVRDIRELAALTRQPITEAVASAVRSELQRARRLSEIEQRRRAVREIVDRLHARPRIGPALADEDLYDDDGLPG